MKNNKKAKDMAVFALFVFPAVAFVLFATDIPFVMNLYYSVFDWNGVGKSMTFVGLDNYIKIFTHDTLFWKGVRFTLKFSIFYVIIVNVISLTVAIVMARENKVNKCRTCVLLCPLHHQPDSDQPDLEVHPWSGL